MFRIAANTFPVRGRRVDRVDAREIERAKIYDYFL
jgi:hypothetical protein